MVFLHPERGREIRVVTDIDQDQVIPCFFLNGTVKEAAHELTNMQASSRLHQYKTDVNRQAVPLPDVMRH